MNTFDIICGPKFLYYVHQNTNIMNLVCVLIKMFLTSFVFCTRPPGLLLLMRVVAVTFCVTLSASLAARQGSTSMAAFQVCLQVWLATSLLADGLAVAGQVRKWFCFFIDFNY